MINTAWGYVITILVAIGATAADWFFSILFARRVRFVGLRSEARDQETLWVREKEHVAEELRERCLDRPPSCFLFAIQNDEQVPIAWHRKPAEVEITVRSCGYVLPLFGLVAGPGDCTGSVTISSDRKRISVEIPEIRPLKTWYLRVLCTPDTLEIEGTLRVRQGHHVQLLVQRFNELVFPGATEVGRLKRVFVRDEEVTRPGISTTLPWLPKVLVILPTWAIYVGIYCVVSSRVRHANPDLVGQAALTSYFGILPFAIFFFFLVLLVSQWSIRTPYPVAQGYKDVKYANLRKDGVLRWVDGRYLNGPESP